ncbi:hypothetical protein CMUS01_09052 [Colletotrichum musicola]|uniref:Integral membrane protein n=1 Tax=Colletotrichum musicola TaxID=2175873 RepID=A0A8H6K9C8_9PEZI|nr:hypothetical protein CMUS01_09052 [Colletotrichum musicola]
MAPSFLMNYMVLLVVVGRRRRVAAISWIEFSKAPARPRKLNCDNTMNSPWNLGHGPDATAALDGTGPGNDSPAGVSPDVGTQSLV